MKTNKKNLKVMVFGVFDLLHPGHLNFFRQAKKLGGKLIVSIARDINAKKTKGYAPIFSERERKLSVEAVKIVDKVVMGDINDPWKHIMKEQPDIVALGYDQHTYLTSNELGRLKKELKRYGVEADVVRLKPYRPSKFKTSMIKENIKRDKQ